MNNDPMSQNPFSLIADFDGDMNELFRHKVEGSLPILPLRNMVLFPGVVAPIAIGRESSLQLIKQAVSKGDDVHFAVACQIDAAVEVPMLDDLYPTGTVAKVLRLIELPGNHTTAIVQAFGRVAIATPPTRVNPYLRARVESLPEVMPEEGDQEFRVLYDTLRETTFKYIRANDNLGPEALFAVQNIGNPILFINFVATNLPLDTEEKALLLEEGDIKKRTFQLLHIVQRELQLAQLKQKIQEKTREEIDQQQKEYFLHQTIKNIQSELGDNEGGELKELREKADALPLSEGVKKLFAKELNRLERTNAQSPDYSIGLTYLETIVSLPWGKTTEDNMDLRRAQRVLDRDHYGMEKVKERILEQLAMMKVSTTHRPAILCLYGPPGVGKTSLCRSIAESLGRKYVRMSLGGLHDESEIRGHRRTYIAAMCGRVMKSLIKAESNNPVFVLDEIDKVSGSNYNGDPQSALLELLDPEQNNSFHDNYLDFDYDLSQVLFIATANNLSTIPGPLRDRMEILNLSSYTELEKIEIARRHLLPRQRTQNGLKAKDIRISASVWPEIIRSYTREAGVRELERVIGQLCRKAARRIVADEKPPIVVTKANLADFLERPKYHAAKQEKKPLVGVVTGLAWTEVGGDVLRTEVNILRGKGKLILTGQLGEVMQESAQAALSYVRSRAGVLHLAEDFYEKDDIHIHLPEGAIPKDGPSAGITMATAMISALTGRKVRSDVAMTGEITLRGNVLPIGGLKEKTLAAYREGVKTIVLPEENARDIEDIPDVVRSSLEFVPVAHMDEVLQVALYN